ncbi:hypothetical protein D477_004097 [Arthrobacter crystallopoietes BAB-32]|uniref:Tetratricopeptide repeat protein n=1 Tax=Arthrobacter crystallopoietes BAB-32 TaxID=1246476 RepID=N1UYJ8_9MICC|nr:hypothetical protein [Arthrobacter crystallopoietes]EMY35466.1 hypothetical protein D477_004097 [Arthrobacter crystallopoietes BAB-32]
MPATERRLLDVLAGSGPDPAAVPASARDCLDRSYEAAYAEDHHGAMLLARLGLEQAGDSETDIVLALYSVMIAVAQIQEDMPKAEEYLRERIDILRRTGRTVQASVEADLGTVLFREATEAELPVLEAALEELVAEKAPHGVIADVKLAVAVALSQQGTRPRALELLEEAVDGYAAGDRTDSMAGALMYLAHTHLQADHPRRAIAAADRLLALPANRALAASMWLLKANLASTGEHVADAIEYALTALELYAACGVRKGAVSAAVVMAQLCAAVGDDEGSVLAWRAAVQQAERGEVREEPTLRLALGNQLLEAEEYELAAQVLDKLLQRQRLAAAPPSEVARTLMSLGHAHRHADRTADALASWRKAVAAFNRAGEFGEAARSLLAIGTLLSREDRDADAIVCFEAAVAAARKEAEDAAVLPQALHSLGHALCEAGDPDGITQLDEAIRLARDYGARWYEADYSDTRARGLWALDHGPAAVSAALQAADLYSAADDAASAGNAELFAAHVLAELDRPADAVPMYRMVLDQPGVSRVLLVAANLGLAGALETLGRKDEAKQARQAAEDAAED